MTGRVLRSMVAGILATTSLPALAAEITAVQSLQQGSALVVVDSAAPSTVLRQVAISGLPIGARLIGFDARPAAGRALYGISGSGQVYAVNGTTGVATALGAPLPLVGFPANTGFDFNPSVDRIRIVTDSNQNFRVNPDTGAVAAVDPNVAYAPGDSGVGSNPAITGAAYTNNVAGGTPTVLYLIDTARGVLVTQGNTSGSVSPNSGQLFTVGSLGVGTINSSTGFDVSATGETVALLTNGLSGAQALYRINLATGQATLIGALPTLAGANYVGLAFTQRPLGLIGVTANQQAVGTAIDRFTGVPSSDLVRLFAGFDSQASDNDRANALQQLGPASFALLPELVFESFNMRDTAVRGYLNEVRSAAGGEGTTVTLDADRRIGMFVNGAARTGHFNGGPDRYHTRYDSQGVIVGLDYRFTPQVTVGVMGGYDDADARLNPLSRASDIDTWFVGGYGTVNLGPFYADAHGSYGKTRFDLQRNVAVGSYSASMQAKTESKNWAAAATVGTRLSTGVFKLEPYGGIRYVRADIDGFSEGPALTALSIAGDKVESLQSIAGLRVAAGIPIVGSAILRATLRGEWRHEFQNDDSRLISASFNGGAIASPFGFNTSPLRRDYAAVGAGIAISGPSRLSMFVEYTGELGKDRAIHGIAGGIRLGF